MSDLQRLVELVRSVADDPTTRYQTRREMRRDEHNRRDQLERVARRQANATALVLRLEDLFDPPAQSHSPTSRAAATAIKPSRQRMSDRVFAWISLHPGCTDEQIAAALEMNPSSARPRRVELSRKGKVVMAGEAVTASGRRAATWKARGEIQD